MDSDGRCVSDFFEKLGVLMKNPCLEYMTVGGDVENWTAAHAFRKYRENLDDGPVKEALISCSIAEDATAYDIRSQVDRRGFHADCT